jgi:hypothetical protein
MLHLIRSEKIKIELLLRELNSTNDPMFISYFQGRLHILEGLTKQQILKIELEMLLSEMARAVLTPDEFHKRLDDLVYRLNVITY